MVAESASSLGPIYMKRISKCLPELAFVTTEPNRFAFIVNFCPTRQQNIGSNNTIHRFAAKLTKSIIDNGQVKQNKREILDFQIAQRQNFGPSQRTLNGAGTKPNRHFVVVARFGLKLESLHTRNIHHTVRCPSVDNQQGFATIHHAADGNMRLLTILAGYEM